MRWTVATGIIWGVFCIVANGLPVASTLAQMAVPWIWIAALVAYRGAGSTGQAALVGGITLLAANVAYFAIGFVAQGASGLPVVGGIRFFVLWTAIGLVVGSAAGVAGWWISVEQKAFFAVVALTTVSIAEPLSLWVHIDHFDAHLAYLGVAALGFAFPLVRFGRTWRKAVKVVALMLVLVYPTAVILEASLVALGQVSPPMRLI